MALFKKKPKGKYDASEDLLASLCGKRVKYVTMRDGSGEEAVIGRSGYINLGEGRVIISCEGKIVFDMPVEEIKAGELLSRDGATFSYTDPETGGRRTVVAHYTYYRK